MAGGSQDKKPGFNPAGIAIGVGAGVALAVAMAIVFSAALGRTKPYTPPA